MTTISMLRSYLVYKLVKIHPFGVSQLKPIFAGFVAGGLAWYARSILGSAPVWMFVVAPVFIVSYVALLIGLGFEAEDREVLSRMKEKLGAFFNKIYRLFKRC